MTTKEKILTFELVPDGDELEIHFDQQGLLFLIGELQKLAESKHELPRHNHLMTPSWGGHELTEEKQCSNSTLINKVTLRLWR